MIETAASKSCSDGALSPSKHVDPTQCFETPTERLRYNPLLWLNLVCLDAPLVAISWHWLFARTFHITIPSGATPALFFTAWLIYLADRFGDSLSLGQHSPASLRQKFCRKHGALWTVSIVMIALADLFFIARLDWFAIRVGAAVGFCALLYLAINRFAPFVWRALPLKEVSIGFIFAAGTMVGLVRSLTSAALPAWLLFAALCALNCISIAIWERDLDLAQGRISIATEFPKIGRAILLLLVALVVISLSPGLVRPNAVGIRMCVAVSGFLLALLHSPGTRLPSDVRTALADLVLLTPLALMR